MYFVGLIQFNIPFVGLKYYEIIQMYKIIYMRNVEPYNNITN